MVLADGRAPVDTGLKSLGTIAMSDVNEAA
jgi:hypothetical protein